MKTLILEQNVNPEWTATPPLTPESLDDPNRWLYKVMKVTNSTTPRVYEQLTKEQADVYCNSVDWEVTIK